MEIISLASQMALVADVFKLNADVFPEFVVMDRTPQTEESLKMLAAYQLIALDGETLVASAHTVPISWTPGQPMPSGWSEVIEQGVTEFAKGVPAATLCGFSVAIRQSHQGKGLSAIMLRAMKDLARQKALSHLLIPVRPTFKARYPLLPMDDFITWRRDDGASFDPWMRVHEREGGKIVEVARNAMKISGTVGEWERWSGLQMKSSGKYIVPGALSPVTIDVDGNTGLYLEDNVWFLYQL